MKESDVGHMLGVVGDNLRVDRILLLFALNIIKEARGQPDVAGV